MNPLKLTISAGLFLAFATTGAFVNAADEENTAEAGTNVKWARIAGIVVPELIVGRRSSTGSCNVGVRCVAGTPGAWTVTNGNAELNLDSGYAQFTVSGLVLATDPFFSNLGTRGGITMVKGTFVCNDTAPGAVELVDTEAVPLSMRGNASFRGYVDLPASCMIEPDDIVFLIRIAEVTPPTPASLVDLWNAFGAVRSIKSATP